MNQFFSLTEKSRNMVSLIVALTLFMNSDLLIFAHDERWPESDVVEAPSINTVITCEGSTVYLGCDNGVILLKSATFGRQSSRICRERRPRDQISNTACSVDVPVISKRCNGLEACELNSERLAGSDPCFGTYKYYTVRYVCIPAEISVTCENDRSVLQCDHGKIRIISANYGRTDRTTCSEGHPFREVRHTNCYSSNALGLVSRRCDWKKRCTVSASNSVFSDPCYGTYKYLYIAYSCTWR